MIIISLILGSRSATLLRVHMIPTNITLLLINNNVIEIYMSASCQCKLNVNRLVRVDHRRSSVCCLAILQFISPRYAW